MWKKIVQRVPATPNPDNDRTALVDMIEFELGFYTSGQNMRARLSEVVSEIRQSGGVVSPENEAALRDVIERLKKIEQLFVDHGFGPGSEAPRD